MIKRSTNILTALASYGNRPCAIPGGQWYFVQSLRRNTRILPIALLAGLSLGGCLGRTSTITVDAEVATLEFGIDAFRLEVGDGEIVEFCVTLNDAICGFAGGEVLGCGLDVPQTHVNVMCGDPILAQWPDTWALTSATWSAPSVPTSGSVIVENASMYALPSGAGILTDPGHSAYVMRLDRDTDFGPADVDFTLRFDHGNDTQAVLKAVEVIVAELQSPASGKILIPVGDLVVDFPNLAAGNTIVIGPVATPSFTWSQAKRLYRE